MVEEQRSHHLDSLQAQYIYLFRQLNSALRWWQKLKKSVNSHGDPWLPSTGETYENENNIIDGRHLTPSRFS